MKLSILLLISIAATGATLHAERHLDSHSHLGTDQTLAFRATVHARAFVDAGPALEIREVKADGVVLSPKIGGYPRVSWSAFAEPTDVVVYVVDPTSFSICQWEDGEMTGRAARYSIPLTSTQIDITYVIHLPGGGSTEPITLTSFEINRMLGLEKKPAEPGATDNPEGAK